MPVSQALRRGRAGGREGDATWSRRYVEKTEAHNTAGLMRRHIYQGFARAAPAAATRPSWPSFLTYGFAELAFQVRPTRQDLVLALFKVLMEVFRALKMPVVVAFDQLEDLLLARRSDDAHRIAEAFFAGIVQVMHQIDGLCFLIFAERGLWNRFVPSLDGYIQDRLNNPVHVPAARHGQGAAAGSAAAGAGPPGGRGPAAAGLRELPRRERVRQPLSRSPTSRSAGSPGPSRRCATCSSSSATCSTTSSTGQTRPGRGSDQSNQRCQWPTVDEIPMAEIPPSRLPVDRAAAAGAANRWP